MSDWDEARKLLNLMVGVLSESRDTICDPEGKGQIIQAQLLTGQKAEAALEKAVEMPANCRRIMAEQGLIIDDLNDPIKKLAFTFYSEIVELANLAQACLAPEDSKRPTNDPSF